ncbi:MAG: methyl-accepting chemotaxis protein [Armatimonadetes bacterium]|nr:methyl-accepting chemotaxis protein [Armatimonadota bacterium]
MGRLIHLRLRFGTKLFWSHLLAVFLVSGSVGTYFYGSAMESLMKSLRSRLQNSAALLSQSIEADQLEDIRTAADIGQPAYQENLAKLRRIRRTNPDIAFLYVMRKTPRGMQFVIDSDESDDQADPGQIYAEAPALMQTGFFAPAVDDQLYRDEWGVFLSGYAPLRNGEGRYLIGIDMRADEVDAKLKQLRLTGAISLLASVLLAMVFSLVIARGLSRRIEMLAAPCRRIAAGRFDTRITFRSHDEFDDLVDAFNLMSEELEQARARNEHTMDELRAAHDQLETRVQERTRELQEAIEKVSVLRGLLPICCSCKKIRDDQGYWQQVETFVEAHSDARFTHGLCPACASDLYGDIIKR